MTKKRFGILILSNLLTVCAFAAGTGGKEGGGGNAVVCFDSEEIPRAIREGKIRRDERGNPIPDGKGGVLRELQGELLDEYVPRIVSVETFDLTEATLPRGTSAKRQDIIAIGEDERIEDYIERLLLRVDAMMPGLSARIRTARAALPSSRTLLQPHGVRKVNDADEIGRIDSRHCVLATVAVQTKIGKEAYDLHIDQRLYAHPLHAKQSQAVLFLHEYVYFVARNILGHTDSRATRALVGAILSLDPSNTAAEFNRLACGIGFTFGADGRNLYSCDDLKLFELSSYLGTQVATMYKSLEQSGQKKAKSNVEWYGTHSETKAMIKLMVRYQSEYSCTYGYGYYLCVEAFANFIQGVNSGQYRLLPADRKLLQRYKNWMSRVERNWKQSIYRVIEREYLANWRQKVATLNGVPKDLREQLHANAMSVIEALAEAFTKPGTYSDRHNRELVIKPFLYDEIMTRKMTLDYVVPEVKEGL